MRPHHLLLSTGLFMSFPSRPAFVSCLFRYGGYLLPPHLLLLEPLPTFSAPLSILTFANTSTSITHGGLVAATPKALLITRLMNLAINSTEELYPKVVEELMGKEGSLVNSTTEEGLLAVVLKQEEQAWGPKEVQEKDEEVARMLAKVWGLNASNNTAL